MEYLVFLRRKGMKSSTKFAHEFLVSDLKPLQRTLRLFLDRTTCRTRVSNLSIRYTPPLPYAVKFSFEFIALYWEIKVTEWGPPTLMSSAPLYISIRNVEEMNQSEQGTRTEDCDVCLRVPYTAAQMPRLF